MPKIIEAIYENGVFKPLQKVNLREGKKVRLQVEEGILEIVERYQAKFRITEKDVNEFLEERR